MIGKTVGHYQVIDKIGEGGMGAVYKAEDTTLHRLVALKTMSSHLTEDEEAQERFIREAQSASSLNHPNITTVHEFIEEGDTRLICMEYVEGKTIRDMVESGDVSVRKAIDIIMQAAEALEAAHNKGILHRDVKSANIMVNMEGRVKVMDFGLAHLEERSQLTRTGTTMGTLSYSSPEQISGRTVDRRSEIFSLGVVFYELLTGQLPFKAPNEAAILYAIVNNEPPEISELQDDVPELVEAVVSRMLEKDAELRYQTCADVIQDLQGISREMETPTAGFISVLKKVRSSRKKVMLQGVAAGVVGAVIIVMGAVLLTSGGKGLNPDRIVVAVFDNKTGNEDLYLEGERTANWVTQVLLRAGKDVIPWATALPSYKYINSKIESGEVTDPIRALAEETGAVLVISGAIYAEGQNLQVASEITDATTGRALIAFEPLVGERDDFGDVIAQFASQVMGFFAVEADERIEVPSRPPSFQAYQVFSEGLQLYLNSYGQGGLSQFYRAFALDPSFYQPLVYASWVLGNLGRPAAEQDSLLGVLSLHYDELSAYHRLWYDLQRAQLDGDIERAYSAMLEAAEMNPGSKAAYNLAYESIKSNRPVRALEALESLDPESGPMRGWAPYWHRVWDAYIWQGKPRKALQAARKGMEQYPDDPYISYLELFTFAALGKADKVRQFLNARYSVPAQLPPPWFSAGESDWLFLARMFHRYGHFEAAMETVDRLLDWYESLSPEERGSINNRIGYSYALMLSERWKEAGSILGELSAEYPGSIRVLGRLGIYVARAGDHERARSIIAQLAGIDGPYVYGFNSYFQACILAWLGEKDEAVRLLDTAYRQGSSYGYKHFFYEFLEPLWEYPAFQEFMKPRG